MALGQSVDMNFAKTAQLIAFAVVIRVGKGIVGEPFTGDAERHVNVGSRKKKLVNPITPRGPNGWFLATLAEPLFLDRDDDLDDEESVKSHRRPSGQLAAAGGLPGHVTRLAILSHFNSTFGQDLKAGDRVFDDPFAGISQGNLKITVVPNDWAVDVHRIARDVEILVRARALNTNRQRLVTHREFPHSGPRTTPSGEHLRKVAKTVSLPFVRRHVTPGLDGPVRSDHVAFHCVTNEIRRRGRPSLICG